MDKQKHNNAFTLLECLLVLLIVSVFSLAILGTRNVSSLTVFTEKMMSYSVLTQEKAFIEKERMMVVIDNTYAKFDDIWFDYPLGITCDATSFHYNAKGSISKANTITCSDGILTRKLIFQLGSGRARIE